MDFKSAQTYWDIKDKENMIMPKEKLLAYFDEFLKKRNTLSLATYADDYIDNTPLEYMYVDGKIYIFTEGGHKFIGLEKNKKVAISICDNYTGFGTINSCQIYGNCEIVEDDSEEFYKLWDFKKIPRSARSKITLHLLRIDIKTVQLLVSEFKKIGYSVRQKIEY